MSEHILKGHNKTRLLYHMVFAAKYGRKVFTEAVASTLQEVCLGIAHGYEIQFIRDKHGGRPCPFLIAKCSGDECISNPNYAQKYYCKAYVCRSSGGEKIIMGRQVLDEWLLGPQGIQEVIRKYVEK